ncbi:molybdopterin molybdotransferase MoeA [Streptomyces sp. ODS05-4]|uniref:molybdopterin molybdotransferase MoeA n=1 Tax=Streptomyces sp. ODS05-4 TaxID=2944939 RepID=UPI00210D01A8|nr:molybdopterin molybdotransferase MoeA [Streptomyces sp. ODS05-4]
MTGADVDGVEEALALLAPLPGEGRASAAPAGRAASAGGSAETQAAESHRATPWGEARALAVRLGAGHPVRSAPTALDQALGRVLADPLTALTDLPSFDTSAMDGWAVAGPGPWTIGGQGPVLAGRAPAVPLPDGEAAPIATGARLPSGATAVIRSEHARTDTADQLHALRPVSHGQDIRPRGQECRTGDQLLPAGATVTPAVLGLAAAAGYDRLPTVERPRVDILVLGDELLTAGLPHDGLIRDALGPMLTPWLAALGAETGEVRRVGDDADTLARAVAGSTADLVLTTGGTAAGPVDHLHAVIETVGAELLVDGVKVRPGHPMLLARSAPHRYLVGLPGNPLAAVAGLLTLAAPLLRGLSGRTAAASRTAAVREAVPGHPFDTRLVPVVHQARDGAVAPVRFHGPAMLRGIAAADGLAVVPPAGARAGDLLEILTLPWAPTPEGCFT